jgi:hypothetical protein
MPLSDSTARSEVTHRTIDMKAYAREDGLYDIEAHLVDRKPFTFTHFSSPKPFLAGQPLHDMWIRLTVDEELVVRNIEAASDTTPFDLCKEAESTLSVLAGERIASGWSKLVKERLHGAASCIHLKEMLIPMATVAIQGVRGLSMKQNNDPADANGIPDNLDSCYALDRSRVVVMRLWPRHYRPPEK